MLISKAFKINVFVAHVDIFWLGEELSPKAPKTNSQFSSNSQTLTLLTYAGATDGLINKAPHGSPSLR